MIKIDLRKAYDTVEWSFLEEMKRALNFPENFIRTVMVCVSSPMYTLMLNGGNQGYFPAKRGLGQGDPLSPLLFVICMEYLTRILKYVGSKKDFRFHPRCKQMNRYNLCFADDLLVFSKGDFKSSYLLMQGIQL